MGSHLIDGEFQSDKYPTCPRGKVPLSCKDKKAQPFLWSYAQIHRSVDAEFSDDLEQALRLAGYVPPDDPAYTIIADGPRGIMWLRAKLDDPNFLSLSANGVRKLLAYIDQLEGQIVALTRGDE